MDQSFYEPALINGEYYYTGCIKPFFYEGNDKIIFDVCLVISSETAFSCQAQLLNSAMYAIEGDADFEWLRASSQVQWSLSELKAINTYEEYAVIEKLVPHHSICVEQDFSE